MDRLRDNVSLLLVTVGGKVTNELPLSLSEVTDVGTMVCIGPVVGTIDGNNSLAVGGTYQGPIAINCSKRRKGPPPAIQVKLAKKFADDRKVLLVEKGEQRVRAASHLDMSKRYSHSSTAKPGEIERKKKHCLQLIKHKRHEYNKVVKTLEGSSNRTNLPDIICV